MPYSGEGLQSEVGSRESVVGAHSKFKVESKAM